MEQDTQLQEDKQTIHGLQKKTMRLEEKIRELRENLIVFVIEPYTGKRSAWNQVILILRKLLLSPKKPSAKNSYCAWNKVTRSRQYWAKSELSTRYFIWCHAVIGLLILKEGSTPINDVWTCCYELLSLNVSVSNVKLVIESVLRNIAHKEVDRLPQKTAVCDMLLECLTCAQAQIGWGVISRWWCVIISNPRQLKYGLVFIANFSFFQDRLRMPWIH